MISIVSILFGCKDGRKSVLTSPFRAVVSFGATSSDEV